jgi:hypothetical protein
MASTFVSNGLHLKEVEAVAKNYTVNAEIGTTPPSRRTIAAGTPLALCR